MALTKVIGSGVGELTNKVGLGLSSPAAALHVQTSTDGTGLSGDDIYVARFHNQEATSDRSFGLDIQAGSSTTDQALRIKDHDGTNTLMIVDGLGHITKPKQSAFLVQPTSAQNDITHGANQTIIFNNERFDQNSDFNSSNYTFTAPVTGKYFFSYSLWVSNIDNQPSYWETYIITSNRNYLYTIDPRAFDQDAGSFTFNNSLVADMDSGDTAKIQVLQQNSGTEQADIQNYSFFSGALIC